MTKRLIYVMNHYSNNSIQHFYHVLNLLVSMADKGVKIALVIEKCENTPDISHENINVICQKKSLGLKRVLELIGILRTLMRLGYSKTFIRISINAALVSIIANKIYGGKTYYWQSGTTLELDKDKKIFNRAKWYIFSYSRLWFVKTFIDYFVTGPETMIKYYTKTLKIKPIKMLLLYNDIDLKRFNCANKSEKLILRERLGIRSDEKIVLMVHRLSPVRKTDKYIPALFEDNLFKERNVRLLIIGEGPEKEVLNQKIKNSKMRDRIEFLGAKPNNEIDQYYRASDAFINPSYTEGFPRVVIEAMACGLPVVATNAGGTIDIFDILQKEFIVDRDDVNLFKEKLKKIIVDENLRIKLSNENSNRVRKFSTEAVSDMYIERIFNNG
jgi:glycosyltransferase involved in cell wall biosynthesis